MATTRSNADVVQFYSDWHNYRPRDKRRQWGYVYVADMGATRRWGFEGERLTKIGVSARPWKRMREIGAKGIVFSSWVHRPFTLETALHKTFAPLSPQVIDYIKRVGWDAYEDAPQWCSTGEEFLLASDDVRFVYRVLDFWQLMNPIVPQHGPPSIGGAGKMPYLGIWQYDSWNWTGEYFFGGFPCPREWL